VNAAAPILETRSLEKRFGGVLAVDGVNFALSRGELRCLIGPNGAGKSTFFKMLTGQIRPSGGRILLEGQDIIGAQPHVIGRRGVGIKNQVPVVMNGLTVRENLWLAARARRKGKAIGAAIDSIANRLELGSILGRLVGELAHGQRQWVEIAMVVICEPTIVLLDEPTAGMSDEETARTADLVRDLNKSATVVVVEHDMQFIRRIARTVTVFHEGRILVEASFQDVIANPVVRNVYLGRHGVM
jgi:branched-chain amino acid transport system ATP-binding protein